MPQPLTGHFLISQEFFFGVPVYDLLGGKLQDEVPFASYLFFRYPNPDGSGEVRTPDQLASHAKQLKESHGFTSHKHDKDPLRPS